MPEPLSFKKQCIGPIVIGLQERLGLKADGVFGRNTQQAVRNLQRARGWMQTGEADAPVFEALGAQFPDEFLRCMNITSALEGTGFGGVNATDIDGFGVTMGIIGFTSRTGEVQKVFNEFLKLRPNGLVGMLSKQRMDKLLYMLSNNSSYHEWNKFAYSQTGHVYEDFELMVYELGKDQDFRNVQVRLAKQQCWLPAIKACERLGVKSMCGHGLVYDGFVQNGGWRPDHQKYLEQETQDGTEATKLRAIARAYAARATKQWRKDVLMRKMLFVEQAGVIHGTYHDLDNYAFDLSL